MTAYSRKPEAIHAAKRFLISCVHRITGELPTYTEVASTYGGTAQGAIPVLNSISCECDESGEPDLSALTVNKRTLRPGMFKGQPVVPGSPNERNWNQELDKIAKHEWAPSDFSTRDGGR